MSNIKPREIVSEEKKYNMFVAKNKPKTRHELNNTAKFTNMKDIDKSSLSTFIYKDVYFWDMFGQNVKVVSISYISEDIIYYTIWGKEITNHKEYKCGSYSTSFKEINDKRLSLDLNIAGGCFYVRKDTV